MDFKIEITLKRFAMIAYVATFWNKPFIEDKIFNFFLEKSNEDIVFVHSLIDTVREDLKCVILPIAISSELEDVTIRLGLSTYNWFLNSHFIKKIYDPFFLNLPCRIPLKFSFYGTVDKAEAEKRWVVAMEGVTVSNKKRQRHLTLGLYYKACTSVQINYINRHSEEMFNFCQENLQERFLWREKMELNRMELERKLNFIVHSLIFLVDREMEDVEEYFPDPDFSKQAYMFHLSVEEKHEVAVRYYWNLLDAREKEENLVNAAVNCIQDYEVYYDELGEFNRRDFYYNEYLDVLIFLLKQMSKDQMKEFLDSTDRFQKDLLLEAIIHSWCWEEFFIPMFDLIKSHSSLHDGEGVTVFFHALLDQIIDAIAYNYYNLGTESNDTICHRMFFAVWEEIKVNECTRFDLSLLRFEEFETLALFKGFDILMMSILLTELDEVSKRNLLELGQRYCKERIRKGQYKLIERFMELVLKSKEEREWFVMDQLDFVADFKEENNFEAVEKILEWQSLVGGKKEGDFEK